MGSGLESIKEYSYSITAIASNFAIQLSVGTSQLCFFLPIICYAVLLIKLTYYAYNIIMLMTWVNNNSCASFLYVPNL